MRYVDLTKDSAVGHVQEMLRRMNQATTAADRFHSFMQHFGRVRPVSFFIGAAPVKDDPGAYRITFRVNLERVGRGEDVARRESEVGDYAHLPISRGGLIGELIAGEHPKFAVDVGPVAAADPHLGTEFAEYKSVMALPVYDEGDILEWTIAFSRRDQGFTPLIMEQALLTSNIVTASQRHLETLQQIKRLNRQLSDQLQRVAQLQQSLLPSHLPRIPGVELATSYLTSDEAGGDYYDFFSLDRGRWGFLIADVSGHGAPAATVMSMLHGIMHSFTSDARDDRAMDPVAALMFANRRLCDANVDGNFVTAFYAVLDPLTGEINYANAGHNPPRLKNAAGGSIREFHDTAGLPLGIDSDARYEAAPTRLRDQDTIVLYTDGITEAFDPPRKRMFGTDGLDSALSLCSGAPDCVVDSVHAALFDHTKRRSRDDDQTLVALRFSHNPWSHPHEEM